MFERLHSCLSASENQVTELMRSSLADRIAHRIGGNEHFGGNATPRISHARNQTLTNHGGKRCRELRTHLRLFRT
jgi:hypothetical protein